LKKLCVAQFVGGNIMLDQWKTIFNGACGALQA
jgi:hypothetical protein